MTLSAKPGDKSEKRLHPVETGSVSDEPNLRGDWFNFFLLILLYTMQGVPLGFTQVIPIILQSNKEYASYKDQVSRAGRRVRNVSASSYRAVAWALEGDGSPVRTDPLQRTNQSMIVGQGWRAYGTCAKSGTLARFQWHVKQIYHIKIVIRKKNLIIYGVVANVNSKK